MKQPTAQDRESARALVWCAGQIAFVRSLRRLATKESRSRSEQFAFENLFKQAMRMTGDKGTLVRRQVPSSGRKA